MKILILMPRQLGDVLLTTTFLPVLHKKYPNAEIHWWAHPLARPILEGQKHLTKVHYWPISFFKIRNIGFDILIDAINYPKSAYCTFFSGAKIRISFRTGNFRDKVYTHLISRESMNSFGYVAHARLKILESLGIKLSDEELKNILPTIPLQEQDYHKPRAWLGDETHFIVISPTSRRLNRIYPIDSITDVALELIIKNNVLVVWSYASGEEEFISKVQKLMEQKISHPLLRQKSKISPLFSLKEAAALISLSKGWIGNSNGASHLATAVGVKTITLYGPSSWQAWSHPDSTKHVAIQRTTGCVGCNKNKCFLDRQECFVDLLPEFVAQRAQSHFFGNHDTNQRNFNYAGFRNLFKTNEPLSQSKV